MSTHESHYRRAHCAQPLLLSRERALLVEVIVAFAKRTGAIYDDDRVLRLDMEEVTRDLNRRCARRMVYTKEMLKCGLMENRARIIRALRSERKRLDALELGK